MLNNNQFKEAFQQVDKLDSIGQINLGDSVLMIQLYHHSHMHDCFSKGNKKLNDKIKNFQLSFLSKRLQVLLMSEFSDQLLLPPLLS